MAQKHSANRPHTVKHNNDIISLSDAYRDHPILWLNPSIYNAQHKEYSSIQNAMHAYDQEKQQIISCYERQLQRVLSQFSIALKQIEYLEQFRKQQNKQQLHVLHSPSAPPSIEIGYESMIEHMNRKIRIMHEEMVNIKNLYIKKMDLLSQQKSMEINDLKKEIEKIRQQNAYEYDEEDNQDMKRNEDMSRHWRPQSRSVFKDDLNIGKLRQIEEKYDALCTEYKSSQGEIENLKKQIVEAQHEQHINGREMGEAQVVQELKKQLKAAQFQQKLLLKKQRDETFLKAKKKIMLKEQRQIAEEEFKLQLEEVQINKDLVINRLAAEYHEMADKREEHEQRVEELQSKLNDLADKHESEVAQLKDEYVSRIHYHRKQIQEYVNTILSKSRELNLYDADDENRRRTSEVLVDQNDLYDENNAHNLSVSVSSPHIKHESEESVASQHSRDDSLMSQISQSADEIVTSLVMGIDEKLDDLFTPSTVATNGSAAHLQRGYSLIDDNNVNIASRIVHNPRDTFEYLDYGITPRDTSVFQNMSFIDPEMSNSDGDDDEHEPQPKQAAKLAPIVGSGPRSNASLLFAKAPIINLMAAEMSDAVTMKMRSTTHQELAEQCVEYEDTMTRYESEIAELRETVDKMLSEHADQEEVIKGLQDKNRKSKRKEFDWVTKEREYKSLLAQYRELRENNAKLTLTYFTLQCEYDKLKRDYDEKSAMIMNYGDVQINLANQMHLDDGEASDGGSSHHNMHTALLLTAKNSQNDADSEIETDEHDHVPLDILSNCSDEDDEVDMVVGFMHRTAATPAADDAHPQMIYLNSGSGDRQHNKQQLSTMSSSHGYNMSYWGNNVAFQYSAKTKDELIGDILKLREKLSEMTDTKFSILQSTKQEIERLASKVKMYEERERNRNQEIHNVDNLEHNIAEIQLDQQINDSGYKTEHKHRTSFGGGTIGMMSNDEHTYTVSRGNDLDSVAKQLASKQHQRAQSYASMASSSKYLSPSATTMQRLDAKMFFDEDHEAEDVEKNNNEEETSQDNQDTSGHVKSLTVLHNISESDEIKID